VTTKAVDIDDVRRGGEPLQRNSIDTIVLFEVIFKVVFESEYKQIEREVRKKSEEKVREEQ
jgi:hypothetical protein